MKQLTLAVLVAALVAPAVARAEKNPYTPRQVCGSGFSVIDSHRFGDPYFTLAVTYLLYNPSTGRNCAVTMKRYNVGNASGVGVTLQRYAGPKRVDQGEYRYYAGPVKVSARGTCVQWGGGARAGIHSAGFQSGWEHCG